MSQNPMELAGASDPNPTRQEPDIDAAREIFPVVFEKDLMDLRPIPVEPEDLPKVTTSSIAQESVTSLNSVPGMEDV